MDHASPLQSRLYTADFFNTRDLKLMNHKVQSRCNFHTIRRRMASCWRPATATSPTLGACAAVNIDIGLLMTNDGRRSCAALWSGCTAIPRHNAENKSFIRHKEPRRFHRIRPMIYLGKSEPAQSSNAAPLAGLRTVRSMSEGRARASAPRTFDPVKAGQMADT